MPRIALKAGETVAVSFFVASLGITLVFGRPLVGVEPWLAQSVITTISIVLTAIVWTRARGTRGSLPAREGYAQAWRELRTGLFATDRVVSYTLTFALLPVYFGAFTGWKIWITSKLPFQWDEPLMLADRALVGTDAWRLLHPVFSTPWLTHALVMVYAYGWVLALNATFAWAALHRRPRFVAANMLAWPFGGVILAGLFISAGPAFYGHVVDGANPFAGLMAHHIALQSSAAYWQSFLWSSYVSQTASVGSGISAMPSMHIAMATLCACVGWQISRFWRIAGIAFVAIMLVGSVYSGWHYLVDGLAAIPFALIVWWVAGRFAD